MASDRLLAAEDAFKFIEFKALLSLALLYAIIALR
jgi:hypothetical protein